MPTDPLTPEDMRAIRQRVLHHRDAWERDGIAFDWSFWPRLMYDLDVVLLAAAERLAEVERERDDYKADYLRRHKVACDRFEEITTLNERLAEVERQLAEADAVLNAVTYKSGAGFIRSRNITDCGTLLAGWIESAFARHASRQPKEPEPPQ